MLLVLDDSIGSFLEFLPLLQHLRNTYTPDTLPVHVIVPNHIGFGFSSPPPVDRNFSTFDNATIMDFLMRGLGFRGYVAQGGDIGHHNARLMGERFESCKGALRLLEGSTQKLRIVALHVNFFTSKPPPGFDMSTLDATDQNAVKIMGLVEKWGMAYVPPQALMSASLGFVVESSPVALLAWCVP